MLLAGQQKDSGAVTWFKSLSLAFITTFALFVLMERLIAMGDVEVEDVTFTPLPELTWKEPPKIETRRDKIERIQEPLEPPELPVDTPVIDTATNFTIPQVNIQKTIPGDTGLGISSRMPIQKLMASAAYPRNALSRGIEGYVDLRFDINAIGQTENIVVLASVPQGVFEKSAIKAAKKWRFQPSMNDGNPEPFFGMTKRVVFEIQK